ncbi:MAG: adenosine deaminase [Acidimicrobiales bacterium]|nr:adenosine deaminase [Acidimicrobiales bacterium]
MDTIREAPKVLLHDHLDGGLRPSTVLELADAVGHVLPAADEAALSAWFHRGANRLDLGLYLETFEHTVGVMQTPEACHRVAAECAADLAADGCVYAEIRFAPALLTEQGMVLDQVLEAVLAGFADGSMGTGLVVRTLVTAMRTSTDSRQVAETAVRYRDRGVVGFDIAGREAGYPPTLHLDAFQYLQRENFHFTIHAGEAFGPASIWEALQYCGAERLGHGVRILDDITTDTDGEVRLGRLASFVRDRRIPLELCPTSNVHTGAAIDISSHPIGDLSRLGFRVTVNTDNRLMSNVSMTSEMAALQDAFAWGLDDLRWLTINAMKSAFLAFDERLAIIDNVIKPGYRTLAGSS